MKRIALKVEVLLSKNDVEQFWSDIWGNEGNFNHNPAWLKLLETSYCPNIIAKDHSIRADTAVILPVYNTKSFSLSFLSWQIYFYVLLTT